MRKQHNGRIAGLILAGLLVLPGALIPGQAQAEDGGTGIAIGAAATGGLLWLSHHHRHHHHRKNSAAANTTTPLPSPSSP